VASSATVTALGAMAISFVVALLSSFNGRQRLADRVGRIAYQPREVGPDVRRDAGLRQRGGGAPDTLRGAQGGGVGGAPRGIPLHRDQPGFQRAVGGQQSEAAGVGVQAPERARPPAAASPGPSSTRLALACGSRSSTSTRRPRA